MKVRMLKTVRSDSSGGQLVAHRGEELMCVLSKHGAVAVLLGGGHHLEVAPEEFVITLMSGQEWAEIVKEKWRRCR